MFLVIIAMAAAAIGFLPEDLTATTRRVPADYPSIQAAMDAAASGDSVIVAPGAYDENLDMRGMNLVLRSEAGPAATTIHGGSRGTVLVMTGGGTVDGFTLRDGAGRGAYLTGATQAIVRNNIIERNFGGGVACKDVNVIIEDNIIRNNNGTHDGAGILVDGGTVIIRNNTIELNLAHDPNIGYDSGIGGGMSVRNIDDCLIAGNTIRNNYSSGSAGGIYGTQYPSLGTATIRENRIEGNGCHFGGGAANTYGFDVIGNLIVNNTADAFGAGLEASSGLVASNTVVGNHHYNSFVMPAGITGWEAVIRNNLVVHNSGGWQPGTNSGIGITCGYSQMYCNNSWGNGYDYVESDSCDARGLRNFSLDPQFCDEAGGDFSISALSPCTPELSLGCGLIGADSVGCGQLISVGGPAPSQGRGLRIASVRPNPTQGQNLVVRFSVPNAARVIVSVFDLLGRRMAGMEVEGLGKGWHELDLSSRARLSPGVYLVRLTQGQESVSTRAVVIR